MGRQGSRYSSHVWLTLSRLTFGSVRVVSTLAQSWSNPLSESMQVCTTIEGLCMCHNGWIGCVPFILDACRPVSVPAIGGVCDMRRVPFFLAARAIRLVKSMPQMGLYVLAHSCIRHAHRGYRESLLFSHSLTHPVQTTLSREFPLRPTAPCMTFFRCP